MPCLVTSCSFVFKDKDYTWSVEIQGLNSLFHTNSVFLSETIIFLDLFALAEALGKGRAG